MPFRRRRARLGRWLASTQLSLCLRWAAYESAGTAAKRESGVWCPRFLWALDWQSHWGPEVGEEGWAGSLAAESLASVSRGSQRTRCSSSSNLSRSSGDPLLLGPIHPIGPLNDLARLGTLDPPDEPGDRQIHVLRLGAPQLRIRVRGSPVEALTHQRAGVPRASTWMNGPRPGRVR